jgi:hypothetical protein
MSYTVKLVFSIAGTRRKFKTFIRPESAYLHNTSSYAIHYDTIQEAETAADATVERMTSSGRLTFIGADFYEVK